VLTLKEIVPCKDTLTSKADRSTVVTVDTQALNVKKFPVDLARQVKAAAALQGKSVAEFVIETLRKAVTEVGYPKKKS
jgi:hypothetical protein